MNRKSIRISFNALGEGFLRCSNAMSFRCLGMMGQPYKPRSTIDPSWHGTKAHPYYSRTYSCAPNNNRAGQCIMNYSILIDGVEGIYIHEWPTPATFRGNGGPTHGCIHLERGNAKRVYDWVDGPTNLTISYPWPRHREGAER